MDKWYYNTIPASSINSSIVEFVLDVINIFCDAVLKKRVFCALRPLFF